MPISSEQPVPDLSGLILEAVTNVELPTASQASSTSKMSRLSRRKKRQNQPSLAAIASSGETVTLNSEYHDCLEQAEICREQARAAARLKRYKAARGLFATAISLCQRALGLRKNQSKNDEAHEAEEYLHQLTIEMSTYSELAKSMERPLSANSHAQTSGNLSSALPLATASLSFSNPVGLERTGN